MSQQQQQQQQQNTALGLQGIGSLFTSPEFAPAGSPITADVLADVERTCPTTLFYSDANDTPMTVFLREDGPWTHLKATEATTQNLHPQ